MTEVGNVGNVGDMGNVGDVGNVGNVGDVRDGGNEGDAEYSGHMGYLTYAEGASITVRTYIHCIQKYLKSVQLCLIFWNELNKPSHQHKNFTRISKSKKNHYQEK